MNLIPKVKSLKITGDLLHYNLPIRICKDSCPFDFETIPIQCKEIFELNEKSSIVKFVLDIELKKEEFIISILKSEVLIRSSSVSGALYGFYTLYQLALQDELQEMIIQDSPDLEVRGVMIDISRNKIPSMDQLMILISELSLMKINHLELYVEGFSFLVKALPEGESLTPLTAEEFTFLQEYAKKLSIDLVPNMNGLGHMSDWLTLEKYRHLAEKEDGFMAWGHHFKASTLFPLNPDSLKLVETMYEELLVCSKSKFFNMNLDEPFELGQGKSKEECEKTSKVEVYLNYVSKLSDFVKSHQLTPLMWGDVVIHHPEAYSLLPKDVILCDWGYDYDYPFERHAKELSEHGVKFLLSPGTSSWNSFASRNKDMLATTLGANQAAKKYQGLGVMTTDWGDFGHLQYHPFSYRGYLYHAGCSWGEEPTQNELNEWLDVFILKQKGLSSILHQLSTYSELENQYVYNSTLVFQTMMFTDPDLRTPIALRSDFLKQSILSRPMTDKAMDDILKLILNQKELLKSYDSLEADEINNCISMMALSINFQKKIIHGLPLSSDDSNLAQKIIQTHQILWLKRNRSGGMNQSLSRLVSLKEIIEFLSKQV